VDDRVGSERATLSRGLGGANPNVLEISQNSAGCRASGDMRREPLASTWRDLTETYLTEAPLCQLKLAPCGYDLIDNLGHTSPRELTYGVEHLEVGQCFMSIFSLTSFAHDQHITLSSRRTVVTYADGSRARSVALARNA